jgi:hypothetical protein
VHDAVVALDACDRVGPEGGVEISRQRGDRVAMRASEAEGLEHLEGTDREVVLRRDERQRHAVPDESAQRDQGLEPGHSCPRHDDPQRVIVRMRVACHRPRVLAAAPLPSGCGRGSRPW